MGKPTYPTHDLVSKCRDILIGISPYISDVFWIATEDNEKILYVSPSFEQIYGRPIDDILKNPHLFIEMIHQDDRDHVMDIMRSHQGTRYDYEHRIVRPDNTVIWISNHVFPIRNENDETSFNVGFIHDITETKKTHIRLSESETLYRTIVENSIDGIAVIQDAKLVYFNNKLLNKVKYTRQELQDLNFLDLIYPEDKQKSAEIYNRLIKQSTPRNVVELRVKTKNDQEIFTEINAVRTSWLGVDALLCFFKDITDRKNAQKALKESEERYRELIENIRDIVYIMDDKGNLVFFNKALEDFIGIKRDRLLHINFKDLITPESFEHIKDIYKKQLIGKDVGTFEVCFYNTRGDIVVLETREHLVWKDGRVVEVHGIGRDITQRKRAEEFLITQEKELNNIFEFTGTSMLIIEDDSTISKCNHEFEQLTGMTKEEIEGKVKWTTFVHPDDLERMMDYHVARRFGDSLVPTHYEFKFIDTNGILKYIYTTIGIIPGTKRSVAALLDITDLKRSENALRESEEIFRNLFDTSKDVIFFSTITGWFYDINRAGEDLFGYTREELLRLDLQDIYRSDEDRTSFQEAIERLGFVKDWEVTFKRKDGNHVDCLVTATLRKSRDGNVIGYQGIIKDISERKRMEEQLSAAKKMEAVGTLAGGMAHNFNNILVGIMGYSEFLLSKKTPDDPDYKALSIIHEGTISASKLTKELLSIARGGEYNLVKLNLNSLIERFLPLIEGTLDKTIEIKTYLAKEIPPINGDIGQIEQCLLNLCINSRDAMPDGGVLIIETYSQYINENFIRAHLGARTGDYVVLSVTDNGRGIPDEHKAHIFEPFFTTKDHKRGSGLGLSTVWGIMKSHNGLITVYSEPNEGTTLRLYFPAIIGQMTHAPSIENFVMASGNQTILLIDDEPVVREMWSDTLTQQGYRVITAEDGIEGIDIFIKEKDAVDLVILDYIMPKMGGRETFLRLREIRPDIKVLVTSGYSTNGKVKDIIGEGASGFIQKPCQLTQLTTTIKEILSAP